MALKIYLCSSNARKLHEYILFFKKYNVPVAIIPKPSEEEAQRLLDSGATLIWDSCNLYKDGDVFSFDKDSFVKNICKLTVRRGSETKEYKATIKGYFYLKERDPVAFGWDDCFVAEGCQQTFHEASEKGLKISARQQALSLAAIDLLWFPVQEFLHINIPMEKPMTLDCSKFEHIKKLPGANDSWIKNVINSTLNVGCNFRAKINKAMGNYWLPGLNAGVPVTQKKDYIHESTFLFHDLIHNLLPDFVFDGEVSPAHRTTYLISRMMSEAISLVVADMFYIDHLATNGDAGNKIEYDFSKRKIYPLYLQMKGRSWEDIFEAISTYVIFGNDELIPSCQEADIFKEHYDRFFALDWVWTNENWNQMVKKKESLSAHFSCFDLEKFGLTSLSGFVKKYNIDNNTDVKKIYYLVLRHYQSIILRAKYCSDELDKQKAVTNGFRKYLLGQTVMFSDLAHNMDEGFFSENQKSQLRSMWSMFVARIDHQDGFSEGEMRFLRQTYNYYLDSLLLDSKISLDDSSMWKEVYPVFTPFYVFYDREKQDLMATIKRILF